MTFRSSSPPRKVPAIRRTRDCSPRVCSLQVRAIAEAACALVANGHTPQVEIMVPLVGSVMELHSVRDEADRIVEQITADAGVDLTIPIGTMIELPRAALTAHRIDEAADFFSFGTNDLTQTTWGFSRDDVEATLFAAYLEKGFPLLRSRTSTRTASADSFRSPRKKGERVGLGSSLGFAANTVAIPIPFTFS
jgi:pyruvate,orthophosphate dikinase